MDGAHKSAPHTLLGSGVVYANLGSRRYSNRCTRSTVGFVLCGLGFFKLSYRTSCHGTALTWEALAPCHKRAWSSSGWLHISDEHATRLAHHFTRCSFAHCRGTVSTLGTGWTATRHLFSH